MFPFKQIFAILSLASLSLVILLGRGVQGYSIGSYVKSVNEETGKMEMCYKPERGPYIEPVDPELEEQMAQKPCAE
jgi:hypothetical protein